MDDVVKPDLEKVFGAKQNRFVVAYPRQDKGGYNLWVYAYDTTPVKSAPGSKQPPGPRGMGRCLGLRAWVDRDLPEGKVIRDMLYEIGDFDADTQSALLALARKELMGNTNPTG